MAITVKGMPLPEMSSVHESARLKPPRRLYGQPAGSRREREGYLNTGAQGVRKGLLDGVGSRLIWSIKVHGARGSCRSPSGGVNHAETSACAGFKALQDRAACANDLGNLLFGHLNTAKLRLLCPLLLLSLQHAARKLDKIELFTAVPFVYEDRSAAQAGLLRVTSVVRKLEKTQ